MSSCWKNWSSIPPTEENLSLITKNLSNLGQVDIVTARERFTNSFVKNWLDHHNISYDNYVSVIDGPMKADLDYDVFIDDSPLNALRILQQKQNSNSVFPTMEINIFQKIESIEFPIFQKQ